MLPEPARPMPRPLLVSAAALTLAACSVGPNYTPPKPPEVAAWHDLANHPNARVNETTNPDPKWWDGFNDAILTQVITKAIGGNLDLQQAVVRVAEAEQSEASARSAGLPGLLLAVVNRLLCLLLQCSGLRFVTIYWQGVCEGAEEIGIGVSAGYFILVVRDVPVLKCIVEAFFGG